MNNNPFLKSKESNNRFHILDNQDTNTNTNTSFNNKTKRPNIDYNSSQNSFTQNSRKDTNSYRNYNDFKPKQRGPHDKITPNINTNDTNLFPQLTNVKQNNTINSTNVGTIDSSTKFKDILNNVIQDDKPKTKPILPGWTQLSRINGKTVIENGPKTTFMIKQEQKENLENDLNYIMFQAVEEMKKRWESYESYYDSIHGEGAYADSFRLPPVYDSEYDTESEEEDEDEDGDGDEDITN
jgi:hypothetical protein